MRGHPTDKVVGVASDATHDTSSRARSHLPYDTDATQLWQESAAHSHPESYAHQQQIVLTGSPTVVSTGIALYARLPRAVAHESYDPPFTSFPRYP